MFTKKGVQRGQNLQVYELLRDGVKAPQPSHKRYVDMITRHATRCVFALSNPFLEEPRWLPSRRA